MGRPKHDRVWARTSSSLPPWSLMLESLELSNFRGFPALKLEGLRRFNVVTGANASGKSALLEAIFCGARGTPEALLSNGQWRGVVPGITAAPLPVTMPVLPQNFRSIWDHWFYSGIKGDISHVMKVEYSTNTGGRYSFSCKFGPEQPLANAGLIPALGGASVSVRGSIAPFKINREYSEHGSIQRSSVDVTLDQRGQINVSAALPPLGPNVFVFSNQNYPESDNVGWYSHLRETGRATELVDFIRSTFPFITGLELLAIGGSTAIYAGLESGAVRRLQFVSSGINKIVSILLACANAGNGIILIDEVENGLFYDKYQLMWSVLYEFAKKFDFQIFASSHSAECLSKLVPTIEKNVGDFTLIRTEREGDKCVARHISGASMLAALRRGGDIRGITELMALGSAGEDLGSETE